MFKFLFNWIFILSSKWVGLAVSFGDIFLKKFILNLIFIYIVAASLIAQLVKNPPVMQESLVDNLGQEDTLETDRLPTPVFLGFPSGSVGKESACNVGDLGSTPVLGRSSGEGKGLPVPVL